jgi:hypothetical protein
MAYVTLAELRRYIRTSESTVNGDVSTNIDDTVLQECIQWAQGVIEAEPPLGTGRLFEAAADTVRYFDAVMDVIDRDLYLDDDLCQITSIVSDGDTVSANDYVTVPRNETPYYIIRLKQNPPDNSVSYWEWSDTPEDSIVITGRWAYSVTAPQKVQLLTLRLAAYYYRQRHFSAETDRPLITDGVTILPSQLPSDVRAMIYALQDHGRG